MKNIGQKKARNHAAWRAKTGQIRREDPIWTDETWVNYGEDTEPVKGSVDWTFTAPSSASGSSSALTFGTGFVFQRGTLLWANQPSTFSFDDGLVLEITLSDETFNRGLFGLNEGQHYGATVEATFRLASAGSPVSVPEPSTALGLFGLGLAAIGFARRRPRNLLSAA